MRYVALGDSYTIGTSVSESERWPNQLVARLARPGPDAGSAAAPLVLVANLAVNGFTSRDLVDVELPGLEALKPDLASVLVGVNDVVQGVPLETYRRNLASILDALIAIVGSAGIFCVTTPDYTVTPAGADYGDPPARARDIRAFNDALLLESRARDVVAIDIHDLSLAAATDRSLVARDSLHPSGAQYSLWVDRIAPVVSTLPGTTP
jgi:acyl-CoA thioesterase I